MLASVYYLLAAEDSVSFLATDTVELSLLALRPLEPPLAIQDMEKASRSGV